MMRDCLSSLKITVRLAHPSGQIHCGDFLDCVAQIRNTSDRLLEFDDQTRLAYHWMKGDEATVWDGMRTELPAILSAQEQVDLTLRVAAPPNHGSFSLQFGIVREDEGWIHAFTSDSVVRLRLDVEAPRRGRFPHAELNVAVAQSGHNTDFFRPSSLVCETINVCNHACTFCAYQDQNRAKGVMPMALFEKLLSQYDEIGGGPISFTTVGEVLLDPLLIQRLDVIETHSAITSVSTTTNATIAARLSDEKLDAIIPRLGAIQISIYGIDTHENHALTQGHNYTSMVSGINRILERSTSVVALAFRTAASRRAIEQWLADNVDFTGTRCEVEVHGPLHEFGNFATLQTTDKPFTGAEWRSNDAHKLQCLYPAAAIKVFWNGNLGFCSCADYENDEELSLGSITETSLVEVFKSKKFQQLWNWSRHGVPDICQRCTHYLPLNDAMNIPHFFTDPKTTLGA